MAGAVVELREKPGEAVAARSTNRRTASDWASVSSAGRRARFGKGQRGHAEGYLTGDAQRFAAGCKDGEFRAGLKQRICQARTRIDHVLAVIQDQQQLFVLEVILQQCNHLRARLLAQAQGAGGEGGHQGRIRQRRQLHQPDAIGVLLQQPGGNL